MKKPAVFIDRDGTLNEQMGYINHVSRFILLPGVAEAIEILNRNKFLSIVISNQSGVARGYFPIELVDRVHAHMRALLEKEKAFIDGIFFCPHHQNGIVPEYSIECECRKPGIGLIQKASESFDIDLANSYVVGDRYIDIEMAHRSNLKGILVTTGYGLGEINYVLPHMPQKPHHIANGLLDAILWIIERGEMKS